MSQQEYIGCPHENRIFLIFYKAKIINGKQYEKKDSLVCPNCCNNPHVVNDSIVDKIFNIEAGDFQDLPQN